MYEYSVALCTYNGSKYLIEQLESIVNQSVAPIQIVISDDGSNDDTLQVADKYLSDKGIRYIIDSNEGEPGVAGNFLHAMRKCTEEVIFTSDQDDYWMKNKAETMLEVYDSNPNALLVFSNGELVDGDMSLLGCDIWKAVGITEHRIKEGNWCHYLLKNCLITGATMSLKKSLLFDIDSIPNEWLHDGWLAWAAVIRNGLVACPVKLIKYRQHGFNVVGMKPIYAIGDKIKGWYKNFEEMPIQRRIRYERYLSLQEKWGYRFTKHYQKELDGCIYFWGKMIDLQNHNRYVRFFTIFRLYFSGFYDLYFTGFRGCVRDILLLFKK